MGLEGTWHNELGSVMRIGPVTDGAFDLVYETAVSAQNCAKGEFAGSGRLDDAPSGQTVAFVVAWQNERANCASVSAWSGELQTVDGEERIVAMWLLTGSTRRTPGPAPTSARTSLPGHMRRRTSWRRT